MELGADLALTLGGRTGTPAESLESAVAVAVLVVGGVVAAWYAATAAVVGACVAAGTVGRRWVAGEHALRRWGAPVMRGAVASLAALGLGAAPALGWSSGADGAPDDLGWGAGSAAPPPSGPVPGVEHHYRVRPGDSLWSIAKQSLASSGTPAPDRAIAVEWPRWYERNRDLIGHDPDLIHPGQELLSPRKVDHS